jgi:hypothetical protein
MYHHNNNEVPLKEKLTALKIIVEESNQARFKLLSEGSFYSRSQVFRREVK